MVSSYVVKFSFDEWISFISAFDELISFISAPVFIIDPIKYVITYFKIFIKLL